MYLSVTTGTKLQTGDLLFPYQGQSDFSQAVASVAGGARIYHVAILGPGGLVWEASHDGVRAVPLAAFYETAASNASATGGAGNTVPVICARLAARWRHLVPKALDWISLREGLPYNGSFGDDKTAFYCSELIVDAFRHARGGVFLFPETPLNFKDAETGTIPEYWIEYYKQLGRPIPQDKPGSHPARLLHAECEGEPVLSPL